jgi:hypothetical protein
MPKGKERTSLLKMFVVMKPKFAGRGRTGLMPVGKTMPVEFGLFV